MEELSDDLMGHRKPVATYAIVSATAAPLLLIGGWTIAAALQPEGFDSARDTISELAGLGARDRWVMTLALLALGCCHIATAIGLRAAAKPGRIILAIGGLATIGVGLLPLQVDSPTPSHAVAAGISFGALAIWPWGARRAKVDANWVLRRGAAAVATVGMVGLVIAFIVLDATTELGGAAERFAAAAEALWPLTVVWCVWIASHRADKTTDATNGQVS